MKSYEIMRYAQAKSVFQYEIAGELKISKYRLSKLFRTDMDDDTQESIIDAIDAISERKSMNRKRTGWSICSHRTVWVSLNPAVDVSMKQGQDDNNSIPSPIDIS